MVIVERRIFKIARHLQVYFAGQDQLAGLVRGLRPFDILHAVMCSTVASDRFRPLLSTQRKTTLVLFEPPCGREQHQCCPALLITQHQSCASRAPLEIQRENVCVRDKIFKSPAAKDRQLSMGSREGIIKIKKIHPEYNTNGLTE